MAKKKKEKVIYYDDNSTLVDMSEVTRNGKKPKQQSTKRQSTASEKWQTYWSTVRVMVFPMLIVLAILCGLYLLLMLLGGNF
jgi:hypothetical protein